MKNNISAISKYTFLAMAIAFASTSCTNDEDVVSPSSETARGSKGIYAQVNVVGSNVATRATESSDDDLRERYLDHLFMIIGNTKGTNQGKFRIIRYTAASISPEGRILILDTDNWKNSFPEVKENSTEVPYHVAVIGNTSDLTYDETNHKIKAGSDEITLDVTDGKSYLTQEQVNKLLKAVQTDNNIYLQYNKNLSSTTTENSSKPNEIGKSKSDTKFLMYGHTTWNASTIENDDLVIIEVQLVRAAAKLQGTFTLSPTLLAEWERVGEPTCQLINYANTSYIANKGLESTGDTDADFSYSPTAIKDAASVPMMTVGDKYVVNAYSYPFSWATGNNNSAPYFCVKCKMKKRSDSSDDRSFEFHVPIIADESITSLERNNIYKVNVIWNFIETGTNTDVTYNSAATTISHEIAEWTDETVKDYTVSDGNVYMIKKEIKYGKKEDMKKTFSGFSWTSPTIYDSKRATYGNGSKLITNKDSDKGYKFGATENNIGKDVYVNFTNSTITIAPEGEISKACSFVFYIKDEVNEKDVWYKFKINFVESVTSDDEYDVTITEETSAVKKVSSVDNGYVAYATTLSDVSAVSDAILATPSATTDNYVSPAFVFVTNTTASSEAKAPSTSAFDYKTGWRLPTQNEIKFINAKLSSALTSGSNYWTYDGSVVDNTGEKQSSQTSAIAIAVHDISASKLSELLK